MKTSSSISSRYFIRRLVLQFFSLAIFCSAVVSCASSSSSKSKLNSTSNSSSESGDSSSVSHGPGPLQPRGLDLDQVISQFAVGSCANQDEDQPIWSAIQGAHPDLFLFIGDNVYASKPEQKPISDQYKKLDRIEGYRNLRSKVPFLVTWDDHDFGQNDGGADNPEKGVARGAFLNYWRFVKDYLPWKLEDGLYYAKIIGPTQIPTKKSSRRRKSVSVPAQKQAQQRVQFIMLDTRSYRSPLKKNEDTSQPLIKFLPTTDTSTTLLGEKQWRWLEAQLKEPADVRFLISSIQFVAETPGFEKWANFPHEKKRFFDLLAKTKVKNLIVLSGDRHLAAIAKQEVKAFGPIYDLTASSLNRPGDLKESDPSYLAPPFNPENFGFVTINWSAREVLLEIKDIEGKGVQSTKVKLN